jgi:cytochrome P450
MPAQPRDAYSIPLEAIDVSDPQLYQDDTYYPYFERLRREDPVHWCPESRYGPYWAVTKYKDIMHIEVNHGIYSSDAGTGGIQIEDQPKDMVRPSFIRMDPPRHDEQRKVVSPIVAPQNLANRRRRSASGHAWCSTACRVARPSTGSSVSRSS